MSEPALLPSASRLRAWPRSTPWIFLVYAASGAGSLAFGPGAREVLIDLLNTAVFAHAAALLGARARKEPLAGAGWRLIGLGMAAQASAQAWAAFILIGSGRHPAFPSWLEGLSFLSLGLTITGLLAWPLASGPGSERLRKGMDGLGIALSTFFIGWFFALGPRFSSADPGSFPSRVVLVVFFLANATILGIGVYLGARQPGRYRGPLGWILGGFGLSLVQVTLQVPLSLRGRYHLGHPLDLLVLLAGLFILLAPLSPRPLEPGPAPEAETRDPSIPALLLPILPAATALAFAFGALVLAPHRLDPPVIGLGILLASLGLLRALLALRDLQRLSTFLEARVKERTQSLEAAQDLLLRTERLNTVAVLGAGMAHDLKNLLGVVRLRADLLAEHLHAVEPGLHPDIEGLVRASTQAESMLLDLLSVGRGQGGAPMPMDLGQRVGQLGTLLRAALPPAIRLTVDLPSRPTLIESQPGRVDQMVVNLVLNARDAMPEGGLLRLRVGLTTEGDRPMAELAISDTGMGIPEAMQTRIFEPFFTTKAPGRGTGLGLASVAQAVADLHGTLSLASEPGRGSTFTLRFPACV
ncbi:MAG TPA: HAMP domain-containing sensor histidine kinase [Holophagaceae bacterium]